MLTLHKDDVREADITPFQGRGRPPVHNAGDVPIRAMVMNCPQASDFIIPQIQPTWEEEAVAEDDAGRKTHAFESFGSEEHWPRSNKFWTSKANKIPRGGSWKIRYESNTNKRAYAPDCRQQASVAERIRVETAREFMADNAERLDSSYAAWMQECADNPDTAPQWMTLADAEPLPLAAAVPPPRAAAGRIYIGQD